jgi:hypothetical protein
MNSENLDIIILFSVTFLVTYYTPMPLSGFDTTFHINKLYFVLYISLFVTLTDVILNKKHLSTTNFVVWLFILITFIVIVFYLIKEQQFVNDESYLLTMLEKHDIDIKMSEKMLEHPDIKSETKQVITTIIKNRKDELNNINNLLPNK